jgi:disulfide bond formation protein DsbB
VVGVVSTSSFSVFFALLSLATWAGVVITGVLAWARHRDPSSRWGQVFGDLAANALWLAGIVALVTTLGSLYYSEIAHFVPCPLCWYQRIAMYPLAIVLLVAAVRRDRTIWCYALGPAAIGAAFALYHAQLQAFPGQGSSFCTLHEPCTTRYVWEFGFVSLPFMALSAFAFILTMVFVARAAPTSKRSISSPAHQPSEQQ